MTILHEIDEIKKKLNSMDEVCVNIALFGQPGAGKSSLINKLTGQKVAQTGTKTDCTVDTKFVKWNGMNLVDLPGYGTEKFPEDKYFEQFDVLKFDLFLCVFSDKFHQADTKFFYRLKENNKACVFVRNKHDSIWEEGKSIDALEREIIDDLNKHVRTNVDLTFTSCQNNKGIDALSKKIMENLDDAKKERWARFAQAYSIEFLEEKKKTCEKYVSYAAASSAANALNPIPGVDIAVDISILLKLFDEIRNAYGITEDKLRNYMTALPLMQKSFNEIISYSTKEGILLLLKRFASRQTTKSITKYIPFVGQAIAAGIGYAITSNAGSYYLDECHKLAETVLKDKLNIKK